MAGEPKRLVVVRLIVIVTVDITDGEFVDLVSMAGQNSSVDAIVAAEIASNLESIRYVEAVAVSRL